MSPFNIVPRLQREFYEAIGRVVVNSTHLEFALGQIITRLAGVAETRGFALVQPYNFDMRIRKISELFEFWVSQPLNEDTKAAIQEMDSIIAAIKLVKDERNKITHRLWYDVEDHSIFPNHTPGRIYPAQRAKFSGRPLGRHFEIEAIELNEVTKIGDELWDLAMKVRLIIPRLPFAGD